MAGIPAGNPVPADSPLFMGFHSGFRKNQTTEDDVTIPDGPLAGASSSLSSQSALRQSGRAPSAAGTSSVTTWT